MECPCQVSLPLGCLFSEGQNLSPFLCRAASLRPASSSSQPTSSFPTRPAGAWERPPTHSAPASLLVPLSLLTPFPLQPLPMGPVPFFPNCSFHSQCSTLPRASLLIGFNTSKKNFNFANFSFPVAFQDLVPSPNLPSPGPAPQPSAPAPSGRYIQSFPTLHLTLLLFWGIFLQCSSYARVSGRLTSGRISRVHTLHIGPTVDRQLGGGSVMCLPCQGMSFPSAGTLV